MGMTHGLRAAKLFEEFWQIPSKEFAPRRMVAMRGPGRLGVTFALLLMLTTQSADARADPSLLCLGTNPGFMFMVEEGNVVRFDYLGDGTYRLDPPLDERPGFGRHEMVTRHDRWPVLIEDRACPILNGTMPVTVEIAVPTSAGMRPLTGCCRWHGP